ncbi:MAG: hypothetical protein IPN02_10990 [Candidatus Microthrix sp.]|uniref:Uncharacterized protein n=1 Tax=Candidatus Neomicrothrix subdominans TaxID=2954438 RepID=A0A936NBQ4_9ACTN|nr:hypothetical protein [Candidatus Microthrix subdominans]
MGRDDLAEPKRVETAALAWLEHHSERPDAQFVLGPLLGRDDLAEPKRVETAALAWLERHSERPDAQFVLGPLLGRDDLAEPKRVETAALAWLEHHSELPNAQFVLSPMVPRRTFTNREVLLRLFVQWCNANYSLKNVTFPNSRQWLKYWIDEVIRPRFEDDGGALTPAAADAFTVRMIPDNRTGIAAALIDDLLVDWLSWPGSMRSALPRSIQNPTIPSRVASLIRVERLQAASPAVVRFQTWIGAWDEPIRSNASALARVPGDL